MKRFHAGPLESLAANAHVWLIFGPVYGVDNNAIVRKLNELADGEGSYRVGLHPDKNSLRWRADSSMDESCVLDGVTIDPTLPGVTLQNAMKISPQAAVSAYASDDHVVVCYDHGIGDAEVMMELLAVISASDDDRAGLLPEVEGRALRYPLTTALRGAVRQDPKAFFGEAATTATRVLSSVGNLARKKLSRTSGPAENLKRRRAVDLTGAAVSVVYARSGNEFIDELKRRRTGPASVTAILTQRALESFAEEGIEIAPEIDMLVDLRRYLPPATRTFANVSSVATLDLRDRPADAVALSARMRTELMSSTIVLKASMSSMLRYSGLHGRLRGAGTPTQEGVLRLTVSDMTKPPGVRKIRWRHPDGDDSLFVVAMPPGDDHRISLAINQVGGQIHLTATFVEGSVDRCAVERALVSVVSIDGEI